MDFTPDQEGQQETEFKSHESAIKFLKFNINGKLLACASITGQNFRIYDTESKKQIFDFKRGSESAEITDMEFSRDDKFFMSSSNRGTIHIFCLENENTSSKNPVKFYESVFSFMARIGKGGYVTKESSFAQMRIGKPAVCIMLEEGKILAVTSLGYFVGEFNPKKGGECKIIDRNDFDYYN